MMNDTLFSQKYLFEEIGDKLRNHRLPYSEIPQYIRDNIRFELFDWQEKALLNFFDYEKIKEIENPNEPNHLLFNMATGTGKTLLMAALILYYYKKGYRNFIFFVNQNNIVGKTEDNLTDPNHNKYLYKQNIVIDNKIINIKKVETFAENCEDIQIIFTSIHKLHNAVYAVKENSLYLEDLQEKDIIMLGDEAHHLNATTKKQKGENIELDLFTELKENASQKDIEKSWEYTVLSLILNKGQQQQEDNNNVLMEFTATVPKDKYVLEKYRDKTIYKFDLKDFLKAGYTKEINLVSSSFDKRQRILQALLFNWYRYRVALDNNIPNFKPVILFRSKFIDKTKENNSEEDYKYFLELMENLSLEDFDFLNSIEEEGLFDITEIYQKGKSRIIDIKRYIKDKEISKREIIDYLKYSFSERFCIITNSKTGTKTKEKTTAEQERLLNSLEDKNNHITAIFTVKRLTEGWDVLNLFDIVRLYEGRDETKTKSGQRKAGEATTSEVQLIGRGVRYFPFSFEEKQINKRKFDNNLNNEMRILEEFYYHSDDDHHYIDELKRELKNKGLIVDTKKIKKFSIKDEFKQSYFYNEVRLFHNEQIENPNRRKLTLEEIKSDFDFIVQIKDSHILETHIEFDKDKDTTRLETNIEDNKTLSKQLKDFELHLILKAINIKAVKDNSVLRFEKLKEEINISSINDVIKDEFLGNFPIKIIVPKYIERLSEISNSNQLKILLKFFEKVSTQLKEISNPNLGSEFKPASFSIFFEDTKEKLIEENEDNKYLEQELIKKNWYVLDSFYGTSEERNLINFLKETMGNLEEKYEQVYLIKNEEVYKIYDFEKGRGFQPDFLLFLKQKQFNLYYQVFIEPKGEQFSDNIGGFKEGKEGWKEIFLGQISKKYGDNKIIKIETKDYKLIGLPLYNYKMKSDFELKYNNLLL